MSEVGGVGGRLRLARVRRRWTIAQVAEACGVRPDALAEWEAARHPIPFRKLVAVSQALGVSELLLLYGGERWDEFLRRITPVASPHQFDVLGQYSDALSGEPPRPEGFRQKEDGAMRAAPAPKEPPRPRSRASRTGSPTCVFCGAVIRRGARVCLSHRWTLMGTSPDDPDR